MKKQKELILTEAEKKLILNNRKVYKKEWYWTECVTPFVIATTMNDDIYKVTDKFFRSNIPHFMSHSDWNNKFDKLITDLQEVVSIPSDNFIDKNTVLIVCKQCGNVSLYKVDKNNNRYYLGNFNRCKKYLSKLTPITENTIKELKLNENL